MKNKKGFTLIEVVAVLIVIAIIATFAIAKFQDSINATKSIGGGRSLANALNTLENETYATELMLNNGIATPSAVYTTVKAQLTGWLADTYYENYSCTVPVDSTAASTTGMNCTYMGSMGFILKRYEHGAGFPCTWKLE